MEFTIRRAEMQDAPIIQRINHRNLPERYSLTFIESELRKDGAHYVVEYGGQIIAYVLAPIHKNVRTPHGILRGTFGHVISIAVEKEFRRKGIGKMLMKKVIEDLKGLVEAILLEVRVTNNPAISLYTSLGFTIAYVRPGYYRDGETGLIMIYRYKRRTLNRSR